MRGPGCTALGAQNDSGPQPARRLDPGVAGPVEGQEHRVSTVHVFPINDLIEHDSEGDDCLCGVTVEPVPGDDGYMGWLITHHSLDGREAGE